MRKSSQILLGNQLSHPVSYFSQRQEGDAAEEAHDATNVGDHVNEGDGGCQDDLQGRLFVNVDLQHTNILPLSYGSVRREVMQQPYTLMNNNLQQ